MFIKKTVVVLSLLCTTVCVAQSVVSPEGFTPRHDKPLIYGRHEMVVTNNPWASKAAYQILKQGGNAIDASVAAAFVLGLTEPSSSGLGGGGYALTYNASDKTLQAYNGRETAPQSATANLFVDKQGLLMPFEDAMLSFKSVGVPGEVALLYQMHRQQGYLPWKTLLQPAINLASKGFPMSPRLNSLLTMDRDILMKDEHVKAVYFTTSGQIKPIHATIKNLAYANTLRTLAKNPSDFYTGRIARDIIEKVNKTAGFSVFSAQDFSRYTPREDHAICADYREDRLCSTPFETGGVTVIELLKLYAHRYSGKTPSDTNWMYYFLEASKLAYADRNQYIADPNFVKQPIDGLLDNDYLLNRSQLITNTPLKTPVMAGIPKGIDRKYAPDVSPKGHGTTSLAIIDKQGNAVSMTVTVEHQFGSHLFVDGFFLNNELTDFSFLAVNAEGKPIANHVEAFKRPRSAMSSMMVFNKKGELIGITGSPGGSPIICYVAKNLIYMLDFNKNPAESSAAGNLCAVNDTPIIESESDLSRYLPKINARGEQAVSAGLLSGVVNIKRAQGGGWYGAADPRREGQAIGG